MRFTVLLYGTPAFRAATYDEVNARIADFHRKREKACRFRVELRVDHIDPGEAPPHHSGYAIVDHHA